VIFSAIEKCFTLSPQSKIPFLQALWNNTTWLAVSSTSNTFLSVAESGPGLKVDNN